MYVIAVIQMAITTIIGSTKMRHYDQSTDTGCCHPDRLLYAVIVAVPIIGIKHQAVFT